MAKEKNIPHELFQPLVIAANTEASKKGSLEAQAAMKANGSASNRNVEPPVNAQLGNDFIKPAPRAVASKEQTDPAGSKKEAQRVIANPGTSKSDERAHEDAITRKGADAKPPQSLGSRNSEDTVTAHSAGAAQIGRSASVQTSEQNAISGRVHQAIPGVHSAVQGIIRDNAPKTVMVNHEPVKVPDKASSQTQVSSEEANKQRQLAEAARHSSAAVTKESERKEAGAAPSNADRTGKQNSNQIALTPVHADILLKPSASGNIDSVERRKFAVGERTDKLDTARTNDAAAHRKAEGISPTVAEDRSQKYSEQERTNNHAPVKQDYREPQIEVSAKPTVQDEVLHQKNRVEPIDIAAPNKREIKAESKHGDTLIIETKAGRNGSGAADAVGRAADGGRKVGGKSVCRDEAEDGGKAKSEKALADNKSVSNTPSGPRATRTEGGGVADHGSAPGGAGRGESGERSGRGEHIPAAGQNHIIEGGRRIVEGILAIPDSLIAARRGPAAEAKPQETKVTAAPKLDITLAVKLADPNVKNTTIGILHRLERNEIDPAENTGARRLVLAARQVGAEKLAELREHLTNSENGRPPRFTDIDAKTMTSYRRVLSMIMDQISGGTKKPEMFGQDRASENRRAENRIQNESHASRSAIRLDAVKVLLHRGTAKVRTESEGDVAPADYLSQTFANNERAQRYEMHKTRCSNCKRSHENKGALCTSCMAASPDTQTASAEAKGESVSALVKSLLHGITSSASQESSHTSMGKL